MTYFSEIYDSTRVFLGDLNASSPSYSNAMLDMGIAAALMVDGAQIEAGGGSSVYAEGSLDPVSGRTIEPSIANNQDKARLSIKAAIQILSPSSTPSSYTTRPLSVKRGNAWEGHLKYLQGLLRKIEGGSMSIRVDSEWSQFQRGTMKAISELLRFPG